jgi:Arc/MetJ-type ribon-helix-helix transcriptional regulator
VAIQLSPEQEHRIEEALRSGAYESPENVIDRALEVLHEQDEWLITKRQAIETKIRNGIGVLERGEGRCVPLSSAAPRHLRLTRNRGILSRSGRKLDRCREILFPRNIKGAHFAVGFDCSYHNLPKGAPL